jgi:hypothetical protein
MVVVKVIRGLYDIAKTLALRCVSFFSIHQLDWLVLGEPGLHALISLSGSTFLMTTVYKVHMFQGEKRPKHN